MRAFRLSAYGEAPTLADIDTPAVPPDGVLVQVAAAALNPLDVKLATGALQGYFPLALPTTVGSDLAGRIVALGSAVSGWHIGDRVVARLDPTLGGALASFAVVPADALVRISDALGDVEAAAVPTAAGTAWQALFEIASLQAGQTVLVHAGAGGVGGFAVQFARAAGARVVATASGDGIALVQRLGADQVIDHRAGDFATAVDRVDLVLDAVGGDTQRRSFGILKPGGTLVALNTPPDAALAEAHGVSASFLFHRSDTARLATVVAAVESGTVVTLDRTVPLAEAAEAFAHQATGRARGKIVVTL